MTPTEMLTQQYMEVLESEARNFTGANKRDMIDSASVIIALYLGRPKSQGYTFRFTKSADIVFAELRKKLYANFLKYENNATRLSQLKNQRIFRKLIEIPQIYGFINRNVQKITLKMRIAKYTQMFRMELEAKVAIAITEGEGQAMLTRAMSAFISNPYDYITPKFRNVWAASRLSAKYNPGTGKYKSAYANLKRLAYFEIFEKYRRADHAIWGSLSEVVGQLVYVNPAYPDRKKDQCDYLQGLYPKAFVHLGWHGRCACLVIPITRGEAIKDIPDAAKAYMNQENPKKWWGKLPFITENLKYWE